MHNHLQVRIYLLRKRFLEGKSAAILVPHQCPVDWTHFVVHKMFVGSSELACF